MGIRIIITPPGAATWTKTRLCARSAGLILEQKKLPFAEFAVGAKHGPGHSTHVDSLTSQEKRSHYDPHQHMIVMTTMGMVVVVTMMGMAAVMMVRVVVMEMTLTG